MTKKASFFIMIALSAVAASLFAKPGTASGKEDSIQSGEVVYCKVPAETILSAADSPDQEASAFDDEFKRYLTGCIQDGGTPMIIVPITGSDSTDESELMNANTTSGRIVSADDILSECGMPIRKILSMDTDFKQFIISHLALDAREPTEYIKLNACSTPAYTNAGKDNPMAGLHLSVAAFKTGDCVQIFPMYEFTEKIRPRGEDSFYFYLGDMFQQYEVSGQVWYQNGYGNWVENGLLLPTRQRMDCSEISGKQLGNASADMYVKGCVMVCADILDGTKQDMVVSYLYNPEQSDDYLDPLQGDGIRYSSGEHVDRASQVFVFDL